MAIKKQHSKCLETVKPVKDALEVINGKWRLAIIISLGVGNDRFTDIQESIPGITPKALTKELKELERHQLVKKLKTEVQPVKITYRLDKYAETLKPIIDPLKEWGLKHSRKISS